ncbi:glycosyl hydrolase family 28-related protein [Stenotrophomonas sp. SORGH_AS_0321]|uniref:glycosyl hydrolase family 28-related protein n=1 Tax=Stenotrophomonas sp. SORGH_AS_0321 TaxID=3041787 RepID=UPI00285589FA|nr:glycosyl hydrolase family 28-related protein [Stenotrophomonas sp. SORGH_AS_0321]MDR6094886.1 hypothetical protein [Stenotrophomonas sp. SORGH_AS_0321]
MVPNLNVVPLVDLPLQPAASQGYLIATDPALKKAVRVYLPDINAAASVVGQQLGAMLAAANVQLSAEVSALVTAIDNTLAQTQQDAEAVLAATGYLVPVAYSAGLDVSSSRFTVSYNGQVYAADPNDVPFISHAAFDTAQWRLIQGVTAADLAQRAGAALIGFAQKGNDSVLRSVSKKLEEFVSVMDYGAVGDGVNDDSAAFAKAMAVAAVKGLRVFVPTCAAYYVVGDVTIPKGVRIKGEASRPYTASTLAEVSGIGGAIVIKQGASSLFKYNSYVNLEDVVLFGRNRSVANTQPADGVTSLVWVEFTRCGIYMFSIGVGGNVALGGAMVNQCNIAYNGTGISNIVDSQVCGGAINANTGAGVFLGNGANDNSFCNVKCEWNNSDNYNFFQSNSNVIVGGVIDRAGRHGVFAGASSETVIAGVKIRRSGRVTAGNNLRIESVVSLVAVGVMYGRGANDDGGGSASPNTCIQAEGASGVISISGGDATRGFVEGGSAFVRNGTIQNLSVRGVVGVRDAELRPGQFSGAVSAPAASSAAITMPCHAIGTFTAASYALDVRGRAADGTVYLLGLQVLIRRESGNALVSTAVRYVTGSAGVAAENMALSFAAAPDGSTVTITVNNNRASGTIGATLALTTSV